MGLPTVTTAGEPILFRVPGPAILKEGANAILLAVGPMKRAGIKVEWREGTPRDPQDGGYIQLGDGRLIAMTFKNDLWHLPVFATASPPPGRPAATSPAVRTVTTSPVSGPNRFYSTNRFSVLAGLTDEQNRDTLKAPKHRKKTGWTEADI
eukprot:3789021-Rhodomonas_salina.1